MPDITYADAKALKAKALNLVLDRAEHTVAVSHAQPLNDRVLLRRVPYEQKDQTVQIADAFKPASNVGVVLGVGPDVEGVSLGDKIMFSFYSAQDVMIDNEKLVLISFQDIWIKL